MPSITRSEADALMGSRQHGDEVRTLLAGKGRGGGAAPSRKEREIVAAILAFLRTVPGVVAWRNNVGAVKTGARFVRFGFAGASDIVGWRRRWVSAPHANGPAEWQWQAQFLAVECKAEKKYPTAEQAAFLEMVKQAGGIALVARSVEDVRKGLGL